VREASRPGYPLQLRQVVGRQAPRPQDSVGHGEFFLRKQQPGGVQEEEESNPVEVAHKNRNEFSGILNQRSELGEQSFFKHALTNLGRRRANLTGSDYNQNAYFHSDKKNEAVPPQHYLSPNQIKPNYFRRNFFRFTKVIRFV
jgi:hypothetical protein